MAVPVGRAGMAVAAASLVRGVQAAAAGRVVPEVQAAQGPAALAVQERQAVLEILGREPRAHLVVLAVVGVPAVAVALEGPPERPSDVRHDIGPLPREGADIVGTTQAA